MEGSLTPALVHPAPPSARNDLFLETSTREVTPETVFPPMASSDQIGSDGDDKLSLVEIGGGMNTRSHSRPTFQIGFGKLFKDDSRTRGARNGTTFEEPGCLYVKTTFAF
jgi:hypothetical protein